MKTLQSAQAQRDDLFSSILFFLKMKAHCWQNDHEIDANTYYPCLLYESYVEDAKVFLPLIIQDVESEQTQKHYFQSNWLC